MDRKLISRLIVSARQAEIEKAKTVDKLMGFLETQIDVFLDDIPNNRAENADNLKEAILSHIDYGEYDLSYLLDDIEQALEKHSIIKG